LDTRADRTLIFLSGFLHQGRVHGCRPGGRAYGDVVEPALYSLWGQIGVSEAHTPGRFTRFKILLPAAQGRSQQPTVLRRSRATPHGNRNATCNDRASKTPACKA